MLARESLNAAFGFTQYDFSVQLDQSCYMADQSQKSMNGTWDTGNTCTKASNLFKRLLLQLNHLFKACGTHFVL